MSGKVTIECAHCGKQFQQHPSRVKYGREKHCSRECQYAARKASQRNEIRLSCIGCGAKVARPPSWTKKAGGGKFCTRACRDKYWVGKNTPNYQGGSDPHRGPHWNRIKREVRKRDGCCQVCGATTRLHVHHVIPFRMFSGHETANDPENLITLCDVHHRQADAQFKWVKFGSGCLRLPSHGVAWQMAKEKGMI